MLALLAQGNGKWGEVTLTKQAVTVAAVSEGSEGELRHFLESVVLQVNSELELEPDPGEALPEADPRKAADQRLTERFRAFAAADCLMDALAAHYSPEEERPLRAYALLASTFATGVGGSLIALQRSGRELPERLSAVDMLLVGVASHKLSRPIAKDKVTS